MTDYEVARWRQYFEAHVAEAIAAEHEFMTQIVAGALGAFSAQLRSEIRGTVAARFEQAKGPKGERGLQGDKGEKGDPGAPGTLPIVNAYRSDAVHNEGDVIVQLGATWQALRDTGRAPPHGDDWICLAAAGIDASTPTIRGTYDAEARYQHLDIVAQGGSSSSATAWSHRYGHSCPTRRLYLVLPCVQIIWTGASELLGTVTL